MIPFRTLPPRPGGAGQVLPWLLVASGLLLAAPPASPDARLAAQEPAQAGSNALRVYLDCQSFRCQREHFRQEIRFVNWVREPQDAEVYVLMTNQGAGGGGQRYTFDFEGREEMEGSERQLSHTSSVTDVEDEVVEALTDLLREGLVAYAQEAGFGQSPAVMTALELVEESVAEREAREQEPVDDPWDFWVFRVNGNAEVEREDIQRTLDVGFGVNANRTTEAWKLNFRANGDFQRQSFELEDSTVRNNQDSWGTSAFAVRTVGEHWGLGAELEADNSTRLNRELLVAVGTGIEYNYFPYAQSNRRVLLARYVVSLEDVRYQDTTIFELTDERTLKHELNLDYESRASWGSANAGLSVSQYLHRPDPQLPDTVEVKTPREFYSVNLRGRISYRLFRGFSVDLNGGYSLVRDQIYLSKDELSDEDILLGRRQLPTDSEFNLRVGLSYSFGSIFNNVVNPRFRRGVR